MRKVTLNLSPPHSVLLIMDHNSGEPPRVFGRRLVSATQTCIAVGTLADADGRTTVEFSGSPESLGADGGMKSVFDGVILTASREVHLCTTALKSLAKLSVPTNAARVRVWANHDSEPDRILIVVTAAEEPVR
jgi:hypothetical protein